VTMLWLGGARANVIETGTGVTCSPSADALFPTTALYDRHPERIFKFGSLTSAPYLYADLDLLQNQGGFEAGTFAAAGWTAAVTGSGAAEAVISPVHSGNYAAELDAGSGTATAYKDVTVRAGQKMTLSWWARSDGTGGNAIMRVRNIHTGSYLTEARSWIDVSADLFPQTGSTYSQSEVTFTVQTMAECRRATVTLRIQIVEEIATQVSYFDDIILVPFVDFVSIHGHNIDPRSTLTLQGSDAPTSGYVSLATLTPIQPAFYETFTEADYRYVKLLFTETNVGSGIIYLGEWVLGAAESFRGPALPLQVNYSDQQVRVPRRFGAPSIYGMGTSQLTSVPMTIRCESVSERDEFMSEWQRTIGGYPVVVVPHDGDSHTDVIFGQVADALPHSWATKRFVTLSTEIEPLPLPLITG
jgi:hypothetical protein